MNGIKLIAMDLDGTLTQHKTPLEEENYNALCALAKKYRLLMVGAGSCERIHKQLGGFPLDVIGNYGLQEAEYDASSGKLNIIKNLTIDCDKESVNKRVDVLREKYGFTEFRGESVEFHASGCVTFAILGTKAHLEDKLAFDPERKMRRAILGEVKALFPEYTVFVGGSSSFDMAPKPHDKAYALSLYCDKHDIKHSEVIFIGDDYGEGGNDESVYKSDFNYIKIDSYKDFAKLTKHLI